MPKRVPFADLRALIDRAESATCPAGQAEVLAELERASSAALRSAVRQARDDGVPWRGLAAEVRAAVTTRRDHVLPAPAFDEFLGRTAELAELRGLLSHRRLVTLTGPGGIGKTRLAAEHVHRVVEEFERVWWVELGPLAAGADVDNVVRAVLGGDPAEVVAGERGTLLVLDGCEHVLDGCARLVPELLAAGELVVIATSREPLGVLGEQTLRVAPLPAGPAVALFADRARAAGHGFELGDERQDLVEELCAHLDGLPLAIELAARQLTMVTPATLASFLDSRLVLLSGGPRTALPRHQSLLASIRWSYELLSPAEQAVLRRLTIFCDSFDRADLPPLCADLDQAGLWDAVAALVAKSMLIAENDRLRVLESVRLFGHAELVRRGEWHSTVDRYVTRMAAYSPSTPATDGVTRAERRAARAKHWRNVEHALELAPRRDDAQYAELVVAVTQTRRQFLATTGSRALVESALSHQRSDRGRAVLMIELGVELICAGDNEQARLLAAQAVQRADDPWLEHLALRVEVIACGRMRDEEAVNRLLPRMAERARETGDPLTIAACQVEIAYELLQRGHLTEADDAVQEGMAYADSLWQSRVLSDLLTTAGMIALQRHHPDRAAAHFAMAMSLDEPHGRLHGLQGMAITLHAGQPDLALRLFGAAGAAMADVGSPWWNRHCADAVNAAALQLGNDTAAALLAEGADMTLDQAVACALADPDAPLLTARETEVAFLVADGRTNREIAARLGVSVRTVATHLENIRAKLDLPTRAHITAWVTRSRVS